MRNGALGFVGATQDLPAYTLGGSTLLVFALPEQREAAAPDAQELEQAIEELEESVAEPDTEADGAAAE